MPLFHNGIGPGEQLNYVEGCLQRHYLAGRVRHSPGAAQRSIPSIEGTLNSTQSIKRKEATESLADSAVPVRVVFWMKNKRHLVTRQLPFQPGSRFGKLFTPTLARILRGWVVSRCGWPPCTIKATFGSL